LAAQKEFTHRVVEPTLQEDADISSGEDVAVPSEQSEAIAARAKYFTFVAKGEYGHRVVL
jgi:hypothetical protein